MKVTLIAGLLLAGFSIPALDAVSDGQEGATTVEMRQPVAPLSVRADDEIAELHDVVRQLEMAMERLEHEAEIRNLERSIQLNREARKRRHELEQLHRKTEYEREDLERDMERRGEELEREQDRLSDALDRRLENLEEEFEEQSERAEAEFDLELSARQADKKSAPQEVRERIESELRLGFVERAQHRARKHRERSHEVHGEGEQELAKLSRIRSEIEGEMLARIREFDAVLEELERDAETRQEEAEARAELEELHMQLELVEQHGKLELERDHIERRIEELEQARHEEECEDEEWEEEEAEDEWVEEEHEDHGDSLAEIHQAIELLQIQVAELRRDVDALAKKVSVR